MSEHCYMIAQDVNHMLFTESVLDEILLSIPDDISAKEQIEKATNTLRHLDMEKGKNYTQCLYLEDKSKSGHCKWIGFKQKYFVFR